MIGSQFDNTPQPWCHARVHELGDDAVKHLQALIRIDTTNPPGNETPAAEYLAELLSRRPAWSRRSSARRPIART